MTLKMKSEEMERHLFRSSSRTIAIDHWPSSLGNLSEEREMHHQISPQTNLTAYFLNHSSTFDLVLTLKRKARRV